MTDADRYVWPLANMGAVTEETMRWNPSADKPLLKHLQDFIDNEASKKDLSWFEKQRKLLN